MQRPVGECCIKPCKYAFQQLMHRCQICKQYIHILCCIDYNIPKIEGEDEYRCLSCYTRLYAAQPTSRASTQPANNASAKTASAQPANRASTQPLSKASTQQSSKASTSSASRASTQPANKASTKPASRASTLPIQPASRSTNQPKNLASTKPSSQPATIEKTGKPVAFRPNHPFILSMKLSEIQLSEAVYNSYVYGIATKLKKDTYKVDWDHTALKQCQCDSEMVMDGMETYRNHPYIKMSFDFDPITPNILRQQNLYEYSQSDAESDDDSDISQKEDDDDKLYDETTLLCLGIRSSHITDVMTKDSNMLEDALSTDEAFNGITWRSSVDLEPPSFRLSPKAGKLKEGYSGLFNTPLSSMFAFMPPLWFKKITYESNEYAKSHFGCTDGKITVSGSNFESINLNEIMIFHGILIFMTLYYILLLG